MRFSAPTSIQAWAHRRALAPIHLQRAAQCPAHAVAQACSCGRATCAPGKLQTSINCYKASTALRNGHVHKLSVDGQSFGEALRNIIARDNHQFLGCRKDRNHRY